MTPEQRRLRAKIAANARWSRPMARADQADAARSAILARLEREVDPAGTLSPDERTVLVRAAARRLSAELNAARARKRQACLPRRADVRGPSAISLRALCLRRGRQPGRIVGRKHRLRGQGLARIGHRVAEFVRQPGIDDRLFAVRCGEHDRLRRWLTSVRPGFGGSYTVPGNLNLDDMHARDYSPGTGTFTATDPWVSVSNQPYAYASDDPVGGTDPTGLITCPNWVPGCGVVTDLQHGLARAGGWFLTQLGCATGVLNGIYVTTPRGVTYKIPEGWTSEPSRTNKGVIFRPPGSEGDANTIRIMEPTSRYPNGHVVIYNSEGQPVDYNLKSHTGPNETHIKEDEKDPSRNCPWMDDSCWPHRGDTVSWLMRWLAMIPVMADRRLEGYRSQRSRIPRCRICQL
jgi:RHS repeat-associated protein